MVYVSIQILAVLSIQCFNERKNHVAQQIIQAVVLNISTERDILGKQGHISRLNLPDAV